MEIYDYSKAAMTILKLNESKKKRYNFSSSKVLSFSVHYSV